MKAALFNKTTKTNRKCTKKSLKSAARRDAQIVPQAHAITLEV
jgi:hypothetical protein